MINWPNKANSLGRQNAPLRSAFGSGDLRRYLSLGNLQLTSTLNKLRLFLINLNLIMPHKTHSKWSNFGHVWKAELFLKK